MRIHLQVRATIYTVDVWETFLLFKAMYLVSQCMNHLRNNGMYVAIGNGGGVLCMDEPMGAEYPIVSCGDYTPL